MNNYAYLSISSRKKPSSNPKVEQSINIFSQATIPLIMLPDYPRLKKVLNEQFVESIKKNVENDPFLGQIQKQEVHEGNTLRITSVDGFSTTTNYPEIASKFEIGFDEIIKDGPKAFFSRKDVISKEMIQGLTKQTLEYLDKVTEKTGNVVSAKEAIAKSSNPILELFEKIELSFDERGFPIMPSIVGSPEDTEKIKGYLKELRTNPEIQEKFLQIIEKKRKQWLDRENSRKLVD
jgi:hypothetical protein